MTTGMTPAAPASSARVTDSHRASTEPAGRPRHTAFAGFTVFTAFTALIAVEALKLRRSSVWVVALILPVLAVVSGSINYMMNQSQLSHGWDSLTSQVFIFYGMFFCSLGIAPAGRGVVAPRSTAARVGTRCAPPGTARLRSSRPRP